MSRAGALMMMTPSSSMAWMPCAPRPGGLWVPGGSAAAAERGAERGGQERGFDVGGGDDACAGALGAHDGFDIADGLDDPEAGIGLVGDGVVVLLEHGVEHVDELALGDLDGGVEDELARGGALDDDVDAQRGADIIDEGGELDGLGEDAEGDGGALGVACPLACLLAPGVLIGGVVVLGVGGVCGGADAQNDRGQSSDHGHGCPSRGDGARRVAAAVRRWNDGRPARVGVRRLGASAPGAGDGSGGASVR